MTYKKPIRLRGRTQVIIRWRAHTITAEFRTSSVPAAIYHARRRYPGCCIINCRRKLALPINVPLDDTRICGD